MSGTSGPLGNLPPNFGGGASASPILTLTNDPTVTATAGLLAQLGTFGGNLYIHLDAGTDVNWFNFSATGLSIPTLTVSPQSTAAGGVFAFYSDLLFIHSNLAESVDTDWVAVTQCKQLFDYLFDQRYNLLALGEERSDIDTTVQDVLYPAAAVGSIHFGNPSDFSDGDYYIMPTGTGTDVIKVAFQCTDSYVAPAGTDHTVDLRPYLPSGTYDDMTDLLHGILTAYTTILWPSGGGGNQNLQWPTTGSAGNQPIITFSTVDDGHLSAVGFYSGRNDGLQILLYFLDNVTALAAQSQLILDSLPHIVHDAEHDEADPFTVVVDGLRADSGYDIDLNMAPGSECDVYVQPDGSDTDTSCLVRTCDASAFPVSPVNCSSVTPGLRLAVCDGTRSTIVRAHIGRRTSPTDAAGMTAHGSHFHASQAFTGAPSGSAVFLDADGWLAADFTSLTFNFSAGASVWLRVTKVYE